MTPEEARALHDRALVLDSHNDTAVALIRRGNLGLGGETGADRRGRAGVVAHLRQQLHPLGEGMQADLPRMRAGGLDAGFFAVDVTRAWGNHLVYALDALGYLVREVEEHADAATIALSAGDIVAAQAAGRRALVLAVENSEVVERSRHAVTMLHRAGVRCITLTHSARTWAGDGCEVAGGSGLTGFGRDLVQELNGRGILVDVSHLNEPGFWDVLELSRAPVMASHSCCRALCDHPRNLTDEQLRGLAANGGSVGLTFVPAFVDAREPSLERLLDHVQHAAAVAGIEHVGLGSDFDGGGDLLTDAAALPEVTLGLAARGLGAPDLRALLGANHLRVLQAAVG